MIVVGELTPRRENGSEGRRKRGRSGPSGLRCDFGKVVTAPGPRLDDHVPVGHRDRLDEELAAEHRPPRHFHRDRLGFEERTILRRQTLDEQIFDDELARRELRRQAADVYRPLHVLRAFPLGQRAQVRPEVHGEHRHQNRCDHGHDDCQDAQEDTAEAALSRRCLGGLLRRFRLCRCLGIVFVHCSTQSPRAPAPPRPTCQVSR